MALDAELAELRKAPPKWVKVAKKGSFPARDRVPAIPATLFDIGERAPIPLTNTFNTFHGAIEPAFLEPGTKLYRVLGPKSADNAVFWMSEAEFKALHNKPEWRERFAVWKNWNANGEFLTYTVPPGQRMPVWRGKAASQRFEENGVPIPADKDGNFFWLEGGHEQIAVNPKLLDPKPASQREFTGWGYDDGDIQVNLVGAPILERNWK